MTRPRRARRSAPWLLLGLALSASACADGEPVDADGDGVVAPHDCDDSDPSVHATVLAYPDLDGDGHGAGQPSTFCTAGEPPPGHARAGTDCAPRDPGAWLGIEDPPADRDGDGFTVREPGALCVGSTVPEPYRAVERGNDCDDADPARFRWVAAYRDEDGDGVGARPRSVLCAGSSFPAGFSNAGYDMDDLDPTRTSDPEPDDLAWLLD